MPAIAVTAMAGWTCSGEITSSRSVAETEAKDLWTGAKRDAIVGKVPRETGGANGVADVAPGLFIHKEVGV
jgi:hypothetical protein